MRSPEEVADALIRAVTEGDLALADELYADDATLWQNTTGATSNKAQALKTVGWLFKTLQNIEYRNVRRRVWEGGFVQEHQLCGGTASGATLRVDACMVATLRDGKIVALHEYMDSAAFAVLRR